MARKGIVETLMKRDGISREEAQEQINICRQHCMDAIDEGDISAPEEIIEDDLGLEPDYLDEILF